MYGDNLENIRLVASRHFRNKKMEYLKRINELATNNKSNNIRDLYRRINEFKWRYLEIICESGEW
jgi:hypothetical protein